MVEAPTSVAAFIGEPGHLGGSDLHKGFIAVEDGLLRRGGKGSLPLLQVT